VVHNELNSILTAWIMALHVDDADRAPPTAGPCRFTLAAGETTKSRDDENRRARDPGTFRLCAQKHYSVDQDVTITNIDVAVDLCKSVLSISQRK